jgi:hypothetical protein
VRLGMASEFANSISSADRSPAKLIHHIDGHSPRQNTQRHVFAEPRAINKSGTLPDHWRSLHHPSTFSTMLSTNRPLTSRRDQHIMQFLSRN